MNREEVSALSEKICAMAAVTDAFKGAEDICLYMPVNNEVDVRPMIDEAGSYGKRIWLPRVEGRDMDFYSYSPGDGLAAGPFGIMEPVSREVLEPGEGTLVIMPGAVFSVDHGRIGYGGGYYDRYLAENPLCRTLAVCYDFQILDEIPMDAHDIRPDMIVSESRVMMR